MKHNKREFIRRWMERNFNMNYFLVTWEEDAAILKDRAGQTIKIYIKGRTLYADDKALASIPSLDDWEEAQNG